MGSEKPGVHVTLHSDRKGMLYGPSVEPADPVHTLRCSSVIIASWSQSPVPSPTLRLCQALREDVHPGHQGSRQAHCMVQ